MLKVGIVGAKAYTAGELIRILKRHPQAEIAALQARVDAPTDIAEFHPALRGICDVPIRPIDLDRLAEECKFAFLTMPHKAGAEYARELLQRGMKVADLSADFRFRDLATFEKTYAIQHPAPELNADAPYALPELFREDIPGKPLAAIPGCHVTTALLALAPLMKVDWIDRESIVIDSKTGVTGGGRNPNTAFHFPECNESVHAYKTAAHRHQPEIEENLSRLAGKEIHVVFSPHLIPMDRGILASVYVRMTKAQTLDNVRGLFEKFYENEPFVRLLPAGGSPRTRDVSYTNFCDIGLVVDSRSNHLIVLAATDNLVKGASGQAVQAMNLMCGFEESAGLL